MKFAFFLFEQIAYSVVCCCVLILRIKMDNFPKHEQQFLSRRQEAITCLLGVSLCGFCVGLFFRFSLHLAFIIVGLVFAILIMVPMYSRQVSVIY